jgi:transposase
VVSSSVSVWVHASAILYSLIETAKANGVDYYAYLSHLPTELPKKDYDLEALMPWCFTKA